MGNGNVEERLDWAARCLRVLSHPTRLHIISLLGQGEQSVHELEQKVQASQSSVSQHLNLLKNKDIVESRRAAQQVFYRLKDPRVLQLTTLSRELFCKE